MEQEREIDAQTVKTREQFSTEDGPVVRGLDEALKSFHVERQAYWSGAFVGNHVHRTLKVYLE